MTALPAGRKRNWSPLVIGALAAAAVLLAAGVLMAVYQEQLYSAQQAKSVREQAQILAASVTAAVVFSDQKAAQEYVEALRVNPELQAAAVYGASGRMLAGFARATRLPPVVTAPSASTGSGFIDIAVPVVQNGTRYGIVLLRALTEPAERRIARYVGLILLVTMGALVIAVLSFSQAALSRRAQELGRVNARLHEEMEERRKTEEALRQSHKMEAIGQLSGGIAHDFNNLIMIVKGNLRLLRRKLGAQADESAAGTYISSADEALDRAAHLTQRILAFSRRQPLTPQRVNLSTLAEGLTQLIRHSVGEKVEITLRLNGTWSSLCDVNQMENVILNLAINARDAMPDGGRPVIETRDVTLAQPPAEMDAENFMPGDYAALAVIDTGTGMPEDVRRRAVDPFFTTKPQGKGTGLGLSMTFGFVRQSGGYLMIESKVGTGTTITILMPRDREGP
jgi:signal transduction histidine kinase